MPASPETDPAPGLPQFGDADARIAYNRVFFALLRIQRSTLPEIEKELRALGLADPVWYEILLATEEAGDAGIQMLVLQKRLFLPQYTLSRHISRMDRAGLIRREAVTGAGRAQRVFLTAAAQGLHAKVWEVYNDRIQHAFGPRLSTDEAYALLRMLNRLYG